LFQINYINIHPETVARGLSKFTTTAAELETEWKAATEELRRLMDAAPWGSDAPGVAFRNAYMLGDGPNYNCDKGDRCVGNLTALGSLVRKSVENARGMDADQAEELRRLLEI